MNKRAMFLALALASGLTGCMPHSHSGGGAPQGNGPSGQQPPGAPGGSGPAGQPQS